MRENYNFTEAREGAFVLLRAIEGKDIGREGIKKTPERVARMWDELTEGYSMDPKEILSTTFAVPDADQGIVVVKDIQFFSQCEHHMIPFYGKVSIAYIPKERVVGLSKFARLTECFARRLQVQERMTNQIFDAINDILHPKGLMVVANAVHLCMVARGIKNPTSSTTTSRIGGVFENDDKARDEALRLLGL